MAPRGIELHWPGRDRGADPAEGGPVELVALERHGPPDSDNLLVHGDNLVAMRALLPTHEGGIDLVYIDPPFATGLSFYSQTDVGDGAIERRAYRDPGGRGMADYLGAIHLRLKLIHRLLAPEGALFLHCDWRANALLRVLLDEIFGPECFRNEIVWRRAPNLGRQAASRQLGRVVDSIFVYSKSPGTPFRGEPPRRSAPVELDRQGKPRGARWDERAQAYFTTAPRGDYTDRSLAELRRQNRVHDSASGKVYIKYFLRQDESGRWVKDQPVDTVWDDYDVRPLRHRPKREEMGYDTQKPEGLLERIVRWASRPGDRVADFYCGSGTTLAVADALGRRWIGCDIGTPAIDVVRRRLLSRDRPAAFRLASTHEAERRAWVHAHGVGSIQATYCAGAAESERAPREAVHVIDHGTAEAIGSICSRASEGSAVTVLAWSWAIDPSDARAIADRRKVSLTLRTIPIDLARGARVETVAFREPPSIEAALRPHAGGWCIELVGLLSSDAFLPGGGPSVPWEATIDSWSIDWSGAAPFSPSWTGARVAGAELPLVSPPQAMTACGHEARVVVHTIHGETATRTLLIDRG